MGLKLAPLLTAAASLPEPTGDRIGRYTLVEKLGEGGCGTVYLAEQQEPVRRQVALKVIKPGMDTRQVIARFEAERQTLALMDHPLVAKVFDAGATETGRPYFVMELVRGARITDYCDQQQLSTHDRLRLFIQVCQAIQHAHQKGIIHRDLKPSNVLVAQHEGVATPRVIDFGIAKATEQRLSEETLTESHLFLGTPAYMSPEQASGADVDTRSDIYSLGVLLYELLTGRLPFDREELRKAGFQEICHKICEEEPLRPSTRLSSLPAADLTVLALRRKTEPAKLTSQVRGDLDWVVMKTLEKDRARRYESAVALAEDVQRHLDHQPVVACPPTRLYQFKKFARRHRTVLAAVIGIAAVLVAGALVSAWQAIRATHAEREQSRLRTAADIARAGESRLRTEAEGNARKALTEASRSQQVAQFLADMLQGVGPSVALGRDTELLREILEQTARRIGTDLKDQPDVEAELRSTIGSTYRQLGDYAKAEAMFREALRLRESLQPTNPGAVADSLNDLGLIRSDRSDLPEAEALHRKALELRRQSLGAGHPDVGGSLNNLAMVLRDRAQYAEAERLLRESLELATRRHGVQHVVVATGLGNLGQVVQLTGRLDEAEVLCRQSLAMFRELKRAEHPAVVTSLNNLGRVLQERRDFAGAEGVFRDALKLRLQLVGEHHPEVAVGLNNLGSVLRSRGCLDEAEALHVQALAINLHRRDDSRRDTALTLGYLGAVLRDREDLPGAAGLLRQAVAIRSGLAPAIHPETAQALNDLGKVLQQRGELAEAESTVREAVWIQMQVGEERKDTAICLGNLAKILHWRDKLEEAETIALQAVVLWRKTLGSGASWDLAGAYHTLGLILVSRREWTEAEAALTEEVAARKQLAQEPPAELAGALNSLGSLLRQRGQLKKAEAMHREAVALFDGRTPEVALADSFSFLGMVLRQGGRLDDAERVHREALALRKELLGESHPDAALSLMRLAEVRWGRRDLAGAERLLVEALAILRKAWTNNPAKVEEGVLNLAELFFLERKFVEAEPLYRELVHSLSGRLPPEHDEVIIATTRLARLLTEWAWQERSSAGSAAGQRAHEAERLLRNCLSVRARTLDPASSRLADTKGRLGSAMLTVAITESDLDAASREARFAEAEPLLLESSTALQKSRASDPRLRRDALERLVRLYEAWDAAAPGAGKADQAARWKQALADFQQAGAERQTKANDAVADGQGGKE